MKLFEECEDLVQKYTLTQDFVALDRIRKERDRWLLRDCWKEVREGFTRLPVRPVSTVFDSSSSAVSIAAPADPLTTSEQESIAALAESLHPWRKGPFRIFDIEIDAEWRSDRKWDRIRPALGDLQDKRIFDVGCGNGYYMFRAAAEYPRLVYGIDPSVAFKFQFEMIQKFAKRPELQYDLLGVEQLPLFQKTFDLTLCMGIVYHHRGPIDILRQLKETLRVGGKCLVETMSIPGDEPVAMFPENRYAKARNVFFVPTASCLINWMQRAGFRAVELVSHVPCTVEEQRKTDWMRFESLSDFLDSNHPQKTVEGYPAPWRTAVIGTRKQ